MAKKSSGLSGAVIGVLVVFGLIAQAVQEYWPVLLVLGVIGAVYWMYRQFSQQTPSSPQEGSLLSGSVTNLSPRTAQPSHSQPTAKPTVQDGDQAWLPAGKAVTVGGYQVTGGMLYVGKGLLGGNGWQAEAALIDPSLSVDRNDDDFTVRRLNYWPSYSEASPAARASYLNWLAKGRSDPSADIGYVFLYFYGLERRALIDSTRSDAAKAELPAIFHEMQRLLGIYGENRSFHRYASSFVDLLAAESADSCCSGSPPPLSPWGELTFVHRLCLGQLASQRKALPGEWAYAWVRGDPTTRLKTSAQRCPEEFKRAFLSQYIREFGEGMLLPQNKTRLKVSHQPASPSLRGNSQYGMTLDLPDVTVLSSPMKKLQAIIDTCTSELDAYSRFLGRNPEKAGSADALLELPFTLWPNEYRKPIEQLRTTIRKAGKPMATKLQKLQGLFPNWHDTNRQRYLSLSRALSEAGLGIEPDLRFGGKLPSVDETVVLYSDDSVQTFREPTAEYGAAALTLHLAASVSAADGSVGEAERQLLLRQMEDWLHLPDAARHRLQAHLRLLLSEPPSLNNLKKRIEGLPTAARQAIGEFLAMVARADNEVTPAEVKMLEKVFKMLGLDVQSVYSLLHVGAEAPVTVRPVVEAGSGYAIPSPPKPKEPGIDLDMGRIAALHTESEKVSAILGAIFSEEAIQIEPASEPQEIETVVVDSVMGLDTEHTALVRLLCARPVWTREELEELAQDRGILLDGALEHVNEAAFDKYEQPFCEGDDPVEINQEVVKEMLQ